MFQQILWVSLAAGQNDRRSVMTSKKILFLCDASDVDIVEKSFANTSTFEPTVETTERILEYGVQAYLERTIELMNKYPSMYDGVVGTHDSSAVFAAILGEKTGKRTTSVKSIINCQNKYISRRIQRRCVQNHTPDFCLALDFLRDRTALKPPFFIKPVRSNISFGTHKVNSTEELHYHICRESLDIAKNNQYFLDALSIDPCYLDPLNVQTCNSFLCEELIEGDQVTVDGFIFEGQVDIFGLTKAVFFPGSNSFSHHEFPYHFPPELQQAISDTIQTLIPALGLENSFFNVELRANEAGNRFSILEVNSRIAFQFAKTIEAVSGCDPLHLLCDLAAGQRPQITSEQVNGYQYCFNFELHSFTDKWILRTPTQSGFEELNIRFPEVRVRNLIYENSLLSDYKHNPESYRYCMLDIPGNSQHEIMDKYAQVVSLLNYEFAETPEV
jgi:hypothetical protein